MSRRADAIDRIGVRAGGGAGSPGSPSRGWSVRGRRALVAAAATVVVVLAAVIAALGLVPPLHGAPPAPHRTLHGRVLVGREVGGARTGQDGLGSSAGYSSPP